MLDAILSETTRVLKPGAILAVRSIDGGLRAPVEVLEAQNNYDVIEPYSSNSFILKKKDAAMTTDEIATSQAFMKIMLKLRLGKDFVQAKGPQEQRHEALNSFLLDFSIKSKESSFSESDEYRRTQGRISIFTNYQLLAVTGNDPVALGSDSMLLDSYGQRIEVLGIPQGWLSMTANGLSNRLATLLEKKNAGALENRMPKAFQRQIATVIRGADAAQAGYTPRQLIALKKYGREPMAEFLKKFNARPKLKEKLGRIFFNKSVSILSIADLLSYNPATLNARITLARLLELNETEITAVKTALKSFGGLRFRASSDDVIGVPVAILWKTEDAASQKILGEHGVYTIGQLYQFTSATLKSWGLNERQIQGIKAGLAEMGLDLADEVMGPIVDRLTSVYMAALKEFADLGPEADGGRALGEAQEDWVSFLKHSGMPTEEVRAKAYVIISATPGLSKTYKDFEKEQVDGSLSDAAQANVDAAEVANPAVNGGIDIQNIDVARTGEGEAIRFDETALRALVDKGFNGLTPVFLGLATVESPLAAMGIK
jgi:hypothetical protein